MDHTKIPWNEPQNANNRHSLAEEFDGVTTRTEGELDDRHVVLYKLGYEPPEEEVQVDAQVRHSIVGEENGREQPFSAM